MPFIGIICVLLLSVYMILRAIKGQTGITLLHLLLGLALLGFVIAVQWLLVMTDSAAAQTLTLGGAGVLAVISVVVLILERRIAHASFNQSQGVFGLGLSVLSVMTFFALPVMSEMMVNSTPAPVVVSQGQGIDTPVPTATIAATVTVALLPTGEPHQPLNTLAPSVTPLAVQQANNMIVALLPTRYVHIAPTHLPATPTPAAVCDGVVQANLNLRDEASIEYQVVASMPAGAEVAVYGRTDDETWLQVKYQTRTGWASAEFIRLPDDCLPLLPVAQY